MSLFWLFCGFWCLTLITGAVFGLPGIIVLWGLMIWGVVLGIRDYNKSSSS